QRCFHPANDVRGVIDHLVERHRHRGLMTRHYITVGIAQQDHIYARLVTNTAHRIVIGRKHTDLLPRHLHVNDGLSGYLGRTLGCGLCTYSFSFGTIAEVASSSQTMLSSTRAVPSMVVKLRRRLVRNTSMRI